MTNRTWIERLLDRDQLIVGFGLIVITALAWAWIVPMSLAIYGPMSGSSTWTMTSEWDARHLLMLFAMWTVMMVAMMLPSAAPVILLYAGVVRSSVPARATMSAYAFTSGYLAVWSTFAAAAVAIQRVLTEALVLTPMMDLSTTRAASAVVALAGLYQITPFKRACLVTCQSPAAFVAEHWRMGTGGAFRMGVTHGTYCLGCCWALMLLLFVGGVMHLPTIVVIATLVLLENLLPLGQRVTAYTWLTGSILLALAVWMIS